MFVTNTNIQSYQLLPKHCPGITDQCAGDYNQSWWHLLKTLTVHYVVSIAIKYIFLSVLIIRSKNQSKIIYKLNLLENILGKVSNLKEASKSLYHWKKLSLAAVSHNYL